MNSRHNSFENLASPSTSLIEKLAGVPILSSVVERQMRDEARADVTGSTPYNYSRQLQQQQQQQQQYIESINKNTHEMFHSLRGGHQQNYERPSRRQSFPSHSFHSNSYRRPFAGSSHSGSFDLHYQPWPSNAYAQSSEPNSQFVSHHSNTSTHPLNKLYGDERNPRVISNLDLESRNMTSEEVPPDSKIATFTHSVVHKSLSETDDAITRHSPVVIDFQETDYKSKTTATNDKNSASSSQFTGKTLVENESEDRDSVFDSPLRGLEQKKHKVIGFKRPRYSEASGFDTSYSVSSKRMRRASGPDRFPSYASSSMLGRPREKPSSTSPHPTDLPFTLDTLTEEIKNESKKCTQSADLLAKKQRLRSVLENIFRSQFPGCVLHLVGSSVNGLGNEHSDADFCLMLTQWREVCVLLNLKKDAQIDQRSEARGILLKLNKLLDNCNFVEDNQVIFATVPIIKFIDAVSNCECDVNINNHVGIRNTFLIKAYCEVDERVGPLVMVVKKWAKKHGINDSKDGTLSSYALTLMVLHYLQYACRPPVLPTLQKIYPEFFSDNGDVNVLLERDVEKIIKDANIPKCQNSETLGELLLGFFQYYAHNFNWDKDAISVRLGHTYSKTYGKAKNKYIFIEEPFDYNNVAKTVYNEENFKRIKLKISLHVEWNLSYSLSILSYGDNTESHKNWKEQVNLFRDVRKDSKLKSSHAKNSSLKR